MKARFDKKEGTSGERRVKLIRGLYQVSLQLATQELFVELADAGSGDGVGPASLASDPTAIPIETSLLVFGFELDPAR